MSFKPALFLTAVDASTQQSFYNRAYKHTHNIPVKQTKTPIMDAFFIIYDI
ncbi:hypothetical protein OKIT_0393 [Oenococcus kitaharae DSM 17330]|uniref:Uncharacterized protein n=1 Tax=Oenococcus kitaharae DSM 17330 TaxID=1045004 RepID=G9WJ65_9LACO|nr:hypothetical protein OKIT_0393 [Oenococcus kitaharae DSM 17330]